MKYLSTQRMGLPLTTEICRKRNNSQGISAKSTRKAHTIQFHSPSPQLRSCIRPCQAPLYLFSLSAFRLITWDTCLNEYFVDTVAGAGHAQGVKRYITGNNTLKPGEPFNSWPSRAEHDSHCRASSALGICARTVSNVAADQCTVCMDGDGCYNYVNYKQMISIPLKAAPEL